MNPNLTIPKDHLAHFCRANHIASLTVFGSALRNDFRPDSDVDLLVEFEPGRTPGLRFVTMAEELEAFFGRPVDLLTRSAAEQSRNPIRRRNILKTAEIIWQIIREDTPTLTHQFQRLLPSDARKGINRCKSRTSKPTWSATRRRTTAAATGCF